MLHLAAWTDLALLNDRTVHSLRIHSVAFRHNHSVSRMKMRGDELAHADSKSAALSTELLSQTLGRLLQCAPSQPLLRRFTDASIRSAILVANRADGVAPPFNR